MPARSTSPETANLAFLTQTTLSVDDTAAIVEALKARFPAIRVPRSEDICYATSNRQAAVKAIAAECDRMLVIGAPNSSNSLRLAEVAERMGVPGPPDRARGGHRLGLARQAADDRADRRRIGARRCWCAKSSTRLRRASK